jgi:hypothetical protein
MDITLDYPVRPRPRYGHGSPPHPQLMELLARGHDRYRSHLEGILAHADALAAIARQPDAGGEPAWINGFIPGLDGAALYTFVADRRPTTYLEVGSGNSTRFARRAVRDAGLTTRIVSIDPEPRAEVDALCDEVVRAPLEDTDLAILDRLRPGDVVFVDNSHRLFTNSDATVVFLELLPRLPAGVLVGIHDIFLPYDYPPEWSDRFYSEQYALAAFLLGGHAGFEIELPAFFASTHAQLGGILNPLWDRPGLAGVERHGGAFWMSAQRRSST